MKDRMLGIYTIIKNIIFPKIFEVRNEISQDEGQE